MQCMHKSAANIDFFVNCNLIIIICVSYVLALGNQKQADLATAKAIRGACQDMCPEKERYMREDRRRLSTYEIIPGSDQVRKISPSHLWIIKTAIHVFNFCSVNPVAATRCLPSAWHMLMTRALNDVQSASVDKSANDWTLAGRNPPAEYKKNEEVRKRIGPKRTLKHAIRKRQLNGSERRLNK